MAKKKKAKQRREEQEAARMNKIQSAVKAKAETAPAVSSAFVEKRKDKQSKKTFAKASGLKSTLAVDNSAVMTVFGRGNEAKLDHRINADLQSESLHPQAALKNVHAPNKQKIHFIGRMQDMNLTADHPLHSHDGERAVGADLLCAKDKLEQLYFGRTFNDNIHIQLIYQILDIQKILALHANNIIFALDNLLHKKNDELSDDFVGMGRMRATIGYDAFRNSTNQKVQETYREFQEFVRRKELLYFGSAFYNGDTRRDEKVIYHILSLAASVRQFCFHNDYTSDDGKGFIKADWMYRLEEALPAEYKDTLDALYLEGVEGLDQSFLKNNTVNIQILCSIFNHDDPNKIAEEYYGFLMTKEYKNMGFSIKKLRECMLELPELSGYKEDQYNSVRSKLYKLFDFIIAHYFRKHPEKGEEMVDCLRLCMTEDEKDSHYEGTAKKLVRELAYDMQEAAEQANGSNITQMQKNEQQGKTKGMFAIRDEIRVSRKPVSYFSKVIYVMTLLLDGKEINDLLTTLINKFENIVSFEDVLRQLNVDCTFKPEFAFFGYDRCRNISGELRLINSFARMQKPSAKAKHVMYRDALRILGLDNGMSEEALDQEVRRILQIGADGKPIKNANKGFRNFIASNVIESSRFRYLVRYNNPHKTRMIAQNEAIVRFVLSEIPDEQIRRYYDVCRDPKLPRSSSREAQVDILTGIITDVNYRIFEDVPQSKKINKDRPDANDRMTLKKQRYQAIVSLYLTVMYLVTKNLVYVNSRYVMAFHALERDAYLYGITNIKGDYRKLTDNLLADENYKKFGHFKNKKWRGIAEQNLRNSDVPVIKSFRNMAAHISVIRNIDLYIGDIQKVDSYFALYHFLMQKLIQRVVPENTKGLSDQTKKYYDALEQYNTYCKDFVKAYCTPFAYVTPRYKNLTIDGLFDRNRPGEDK